MSRAISLCWITAKVASLGFSSIALLEMIAGGFVALFCFRRRMMCLLEKIYDVQGGRDRKDVISLPADLIQELWGLVILCPLAVADLRAVFNNKVYMVDASNWGEAVVCSDLEGGMRSEVHRHCLSKSSWTKLLTPFKAHLKGKDDLPVEDEMPCGEVCYTEHPVWEVIARCLPYRVCWKRRAKKGRHINIGELRAYIKAEAIAATSGSDTRVPICGDSQVVCGVICKGRSASPCLNRELRKNIAITLGFGIYSSPGYARSAHNPADDPTRGVSLRSPDCELPDWWIDSVGGCYKSLDRFLACNNLAPHQLCGFPSLQELNLKDPKIVDKHLTLSSKKASMVKVKEKLKLRAVSRVKNSGVISGVKNFPWDQETQDLLVSFGKDQFIFGEGYEWPPNVPGFLDLYSGKKGFAYASARLGAPWILVIDILDGPQCDLLDKRVRSVLECLLKRGVFIHFSSAPICSSFSTAITPPVRSPAEPAGIMPLRPGMATKILEGNSHSRWLSMMICICISLGIRYWVENPDSSYLWRQKEWLHLPGDAQNRFFRVDFCTFKTPWRKRTRFLTDNRLGGTKRLCSRDHVHRLLRGRCRENKIAMTKLAEPYPKELCSLLAWAACSDLDILKMPCGLCCKADHRRIGEAKNPGPRRPGVQSRSVLGLDDVELVRPETVAIGKTAWQGFMAWAEGSAGASCVASMWLAPGLFGAMLGAYGRQLYEWGKPLYVFRHLVVYSQRTYPGLRGHFQSGWDVINRWEELEPVEHRRPLPAKLVEAMCCLALMWEWPHVCAVILMAFHGCCRPGEVLNASRGHLVLPRDLACVDGPCFLRIAKPKPGRRGLGRVQHAKIVDEAVVTFLDKLYGSRRSDTLIYSASANAFRTRWNKLLKALEVPASSELTPAGLRAGGTVHQYRGGTPILDLLWTLRLKNVETLQHYLQEIATQITMVDLPENSKRLILVFADFYFFRLSSFQH